MNTKVHELINQQINKEFYSAYLYLDFSNYFEEAGLDGFANWYKIQALEERDHAMLFYQYLQNENQKVTLEAIEKPGKAFCVGKLQRSGYCFGYKFMKLAFKRMRIFKSICPFGKLY